MNISRVKIKNFRNFESLDLALGEHAVIVGENKIGKSNFLYALRLVPDPSLPDAARKPRKEEFWGGLRCPLAADSHGLRGHAVISRRVMRIRDQVGRCPNQRAEIMRSRPIA